MNPRGSLATLVALLCLAGAAEAQQTGGSFGGSRWGAGRPSAPPPRPAPTYRPAPTPTYRPAPTPTYRPPPVYRPAPTPTYRPPPVYAPAPTYPSYPSPTKTYPTKNWGSGYNPVPAPTPPPAPASHSGGGSCCGSVFAILSFGLMGVVVGARRRPRR